MPWSVRIMCPMSGIMRTYLCYIRVRGILPTPISFWGDLLECDGGGASSTWIDGTAWPGSVTGGGSAASGFPFGGPINLLMDVEWCRGCARTFMLGDGFKHQWGENWLGIILPSLWTGPKLENSPRLGSYVSDTSGSSSTMDQCGLPSWTSWCPGSLSPVAVAKSWCLELDIPVSS